MDSNFVYGQLVASGKTFIGIKPTLRQADV